MNIPTPQSIITILDSNYNRIHELPEKSVRPVILWEFGNRVIGLHNNEHILITGKVITSRWVSYNLNTNLLKFRIL